MNNKGFIKLSSLFYLCLIVLAVIYVQKHGSIDFVQLFKKISDHTLNFIYMIRDFLINIITTALKK